MLERKIEDMNLLLFFTTLKIPSQVDVAPPKAINGQRDWPLLGRLVPLEHLSGVKYLKWAHLTAGACDGKVVGLAVE